jgi:chitin synthase
LTGCFSVNIILACPQLVTDPSTALTLKNFSALVPSAVHASGAQASAQGTALDQDDWYTSRIKSKIKQYHKGPLVWLWKVLKIDAADTDIAK